MENLPIADYLLITLEICAAIIGTSYYRKTKRQDTSLKYLVFLLWMTAFFEVFALLPYLVKAFEELYFLKGTIFEYNDWVFNVLIFISYVLYIMYFRTNVVSNIVRKVLLVLIVLFVVSIISNFIISDVFFKKLSTLTDVLGSVILLLSVMFYFYEVLLSERVLVFYKLLAFYVAIGALIFHLTITPIDIYFEYAVDSDSNFFKFRSFVLYSASFFMYTCYIIGFIVCSKKNKSY